MLRLRRFHTLTSKFQQNFQELILQFLTHVILMQMLQSGKRKQKILQEDLLRTSQNTKEMKLERHLFLLDRNCKNQQILQKLEQF